MIELLSAEIMGYDIPYEGDYSAGPAIGHSDLREIASCPHRWRFGGKKEPSDAMLWGSLVDSLLFGVGLDRFAVRPATYKDGETEKPWNANAKACKQWLDDHKGHYIITPTMKREAQVAVNLLRNDPTINGLHGVSRFQCWVAGVFHCTETDITIPVRGLIDIVPDSKSAYKNYLGDLKTCADGSASCWARVCEKRWYHVQAGLYLDLWNKATGENRTGFLHIIQENKPPYETGRRELADSAIRLGKAVYLRTLETYARCISTGKWDKLDGDNEWSIVEFGDYAVNRAGIDPLDGEMPNWDEE